MSKNITIPFSTFEQIIELLDDIDAERYGCNFYNAYCEVLTKLKAKMKKSNFVTHMLKLFRLRMKTKNFMRV